MNDLDVLNEPSAPVDALPEAEPAAEPTPETAEATSPAAAETAATESESETSPDTGHTEDGDDADNAARIEVEYPDETEGDGDEAGEAGQEPTAENELSAAAQRFGTSALTRMLKDNPEIEKAVAGQPRLKAQLYQMARRSQELAQFHDVLPSLTRAREAAQAAGQLQQFDQAYYGDNPQAFWKSLYEAQMRPDPTTGQAKSSGAYERNVQFLHQGFLDRIEQQALRVGSSDLTTAVQSIREALGWAQGRSPHSPAQDGEQRPNRNEQDLPPHIRQRLEQADANARELEQLRSRRSEEERQQQKTFMDDTASEVGRELRGFVDGLLANAKLSDYDKQNIARDFLERVSELAGQDRVHNAALEELLRSGGPTTQTRARMVARAKAWARQNGRDILEPILAKAGAGLRQRQQQREAVAARHRAEPAATGAPVNPAQPSARDLVRSAEQRLGRRLTDREILELA